MLRFPITASHAISQNEEGFAMLYHLYSKLHFPSVKILVMNRLQMLKNRIGRRISRFSSQNGWEKFKLQLIFIIYEVHIYIYC